jgi:hypothetical protein
MSGRDPVRTSPNSVRVPGIRHLLDRPDSTVAIDGYQKGEQARCS